MTTAEYYGVARPRRHRAIGEFNSYSDMGIGTILGAILSDVVTRYRTWRKLRRAVGELRGLDDRMLKDIGLARSSLYDSARRVHEAGRGWK